MRAVLVILLSTAAYADLAAPAVSVGDSDIVCAGQRCFIRRSFLEHVLPGPTEPAPETNFVPTVVDGRPHGFRLYAIRPRSLYARLMLQNGDRIVAVNGLALDTPDQALELYSRFRNTSRFEVEVERRGKTLRFDYVIR